MQMSSVRNERGIALVLAVLALVVISALVTGTLFVSTAEQRTSVNGVAARKAFEAAEAGLQTEIVNWNTNLNAMTAGSFVPSSSGNFASTSGASYANTVYRLNSQVFLIQAMGTQGNATQTLAALVRLATVNPSVSAAVTARGNVSVGGNAAINGTNTPPTGWGSCTTSPDMGGIRTSGTVSTNGNPDIAGSPRTVQNDPTVTSDLFQDPFNRFKRMATISLTGGTAGNFTVFSSIAPSTTGSPAQCNRADQNNWGEPLRSGTYKSECTSYAPVVYINGNAKFNSQGRGQGVLLVDGDLSISGGFNWVGIVIATGQVQTGNGNANITGALLAQNATIGDQTSFSGTPVVSYSRCALDYVLNMSAKVQPIAARSWSQVY